MITTHKAKKLLAEELHRLNLPYTKLTARTVSFVDLARDYAVFVTVHGWEPNPLWDELKRFASNNGFFINAPM